MPDKIKTPLNRRLSRRQVLAECGAGAVGLALAGCHSTPRRAPEAMLTCGEITIAKTAGPFYTPDTPQRGSFLEDGAGTPLRLVGQVLDDRCEPVPGALLDFWQADGDGQYDNEGYRFRGHQYAGDDGTFTLDTVVPGRYPGRPRHIHVKVTGEGRPLLTTQLFFPDDPTNVDDGIFSDSLLVSVEDGPADLRLVSFDFVLPS